MIIQISGSTTNSSVNLTIGSPTASVQVVVPQYVVQANRAVSASYADVALVALTAAGNIESASFATFAVSASRVDWININGVPTLVSSSAQVDYSQLQNLPTTIATASLALQAISASFAPTILPNGIVSSSAQITYLNITGIPSSSSGPSGSVG
jgi:hypothetical protein